LCAGKTVWILYALCRCLGERQSVIWYRGEQSILFWEGGVKYIDPQNGEYPEHTWCLVDSMYADRLPSHIAERDSGLFPVYVTSPEEERWAKLHQLRLRDLIIMNPWTMAELERA
jgi:hypothetical protein